MIRFGHTPNDLSESVRLAIQSLREEDQDAATETSATADAELDMESGSPAVSAHVSALMLADYTRHVPGSVFRARA